MTYNRTYTNKPFRLKATIENGYEGDPSIPNGTRNLYDITAIEVFVDQPTADIAETLDAGFMEYLEEYVIKCFKEEGKC